MTTISMTAVAQILVEEGVPAELWHTGGGIYCIYVGPQNEDDRFRLIAGPGNEEETDIVFDAHEIYVGPDDEGETHMDNLREQGVTTVRQVVDAIKEALR